MENSVHFYFAQGLAANTMRSYRSAQSRYTKFCSQFNINPVPLAESSLCAFVSQLANEGLKFQTIKCYLSGLRHMHISAGLADPFAGEGFIRLHYVLRGVRKCQANNSAATRSSRPLRLPITPTILRAIRSQWGACWDHPDTVMLWAAFCIGFFGFLRAGEFTVPDGAYDHNAHLSFNDIAIDSHVSPSVLLIHLKASKTDPFRQGVDIVIGKTDDDLCPVQATVRFLAIRGDSPGPLFQFSDGRFLSRDRLVISLKRVLSEAGIDTSRFNGHSFRIGAATSAARAGLEDSLIKTMGRWESSAYLRYIRTSRDQLAAVASSLSALN